MTKKTLSLWVAGLTLLAHLVSYITIYIFLDLRQGTFDAGQLAGSVIPVTGGYVGILITFGAAHFHTLPSDFDRKVQPLSAALAVFGPLPILIGVPMVAFMANNSVLNTMDEITGATVPLLAASAALMGPFIGILFGESREG